MCLTLRHQRKLPAQFTAGEEMKGRMTFKKLTIWFICAAMVFTSTGMLTACSKKEESNTLSVNALQEKIDNKTDAYMTDLNDSRSGLTSNKKMARYIMNWAESKGIRAKTDDGGVIIMNVDGSEKYKDVPKTVIVCPYDELDFEGTLNCLILTFYVLKNNEDTGKLSAIFLPEKGHDLSSAESIKKEYFGKKSRIICLAGNQHASVGRSTGGCSRYIFSKNYNTVKPKNKVAFKIRISGIKRGQINSDINAKINPIIELNSLLASLRSSSIDFEIASMRGGKDGLMYPGGCTLTITVDEDRQSTFENKLANRIESFDKRKQTEDPDAVYEYEETKVPGKVIGQKDSSELVGFIYTLLEDEYHQDEDTDELMAVCDISNIRTRNGKVRIGSNACSIDMGRIYEIDEAEKTLCGLSGFKFDKISSYPSWVADDESEFTEAFKKAYKKYTGKKLKITSQVTPAYTSKIAELRKEADILSVTVSDNTLTDLTGAVMEYLIKSDQPVD